MFRLPHRQRTRLAFALAQVCVAAAVQAQDGSSVKAFDAAVLRRQLESAVQLARGLKIVVRKTTLLEGEPLAVTIDVPQAGYLNVISVDAAGTATVLFPNQYQPDNHLAAGPFALPGPQMPFELLAAPPFGTSFVTAFLTTEPIDLAELGAIQSRFAQLSNAGRGLIDALGTKALLSDTSSFSMLAGSVSVQVCPKTGLCDRSPASDGGEAPASSGGLATHVRSVLDALTPGILLEVSEKSFRTYRGPLRPVYDRGLRLVKVSEGFVSYPYNDSARMCSVAYGHLIKRKPCDGSELPEFRRGMPESEGAKLLVNDMALAQRAVMSLVSVELTPGQFAALCDFTYNVGAGNLMRSTLLKAVNSKQNARVPGQLRRWVNAGGKPQRGLAIRRERELALFFEGQAIPKGVPAPGDRDTDIDIRAGEPGS